MRSAATHACTRLLRRKLREGDTGKVTAGLGAKEVRVWVMRGALVACSSRDDSAKLVRQLARKGLMPTFRAEELIGRMQGHLPLIPLLADEVAVEELSELLVEQFRANLILFVGAAEDLSPEFTATATVMAHNVQAGLDPEVELMRAVRACDEARGVETELDVEPTPPPAGPPPPEPEVVEVPEPEATLLDAPDLVLPDADVGDGYAPVEVLAPLELSPFELDDDEDLTEIRSIQIEERKEPEIEERPQPEVEERKEPAQEPNQRGGAEKPRPLRRAPASLPPESWFSPLASGAPAEELEGFEDHQHHDAHASGGQFSTERHNLDRVVATLPSEDPGETEDTTTTLSLDVPPPDDLEALRKIDVASEVLQVVTAAFARWTGQKGTAQSQLLLEGCPRRFSPLFSGLRLDADGSLPGTALLANLNRRPKGERKLLLEQALMDLTERALSSVADELAEEAVEEVLEAVVGYRTRLRG